MHFCVFLAEIFTFLFISRIFNCHFYTIQPAFVAYIFVTHCILLPNGPPDAMCVCVHIHI